MARRSRVTFKNAKGKVSFLAKANKKKAQKKREKQIEIREEEVT